MKRAGDVIPKILGLAPIQDSNQDRHQEHPPPGTRGSLFRMPARCPECGSEVRRTVLARDQDRRQVKQEKDKQEKDKQEKDMWEAGHEEASPEGDGEEEGDRRGTGAGMSVL